MWDWIRARATAVGVAVATFFAGILAGVGIPLPGDWESNLTLVVGGLLFGAATALITWVAGRIGIGVNPPTP